MKRTNVPVLTKEDFCFNPLLSIYQHYTHDGYEVCIEPCLNGFDIAIYKDMNLQVSKICTNLEKPFGDKAHSEMCWKLAIGYANQLLGEVNVLKGGDTCEAK